MTVPYDEEPRRIIDWANLSTNEPEGGNEAEREESARLADATQAKSEEVEFADNPEPRCACVLVLDVSGSMQGKRIEELNKGVQLLYDEIRNDDIASLRVELAMLVFHDVVVLMHDFITIDRNTQPPVLKAGGATTMCQAINHSIKMLQDRKQTYRRNGAPYYRPWIMLITDGGPSDGYMVQSTAQAVREGFNKRELTFFAIGVEEANFEVLKQIAPDDYPPMKLEGLNYSELFRWLSASLSAVSQSRTDEQISLPATGWGTLPT